MKVEELTLEEKLKLLVTKKSFSFHDLDGKIIEVTMSDGPCGVRKGLVEETEDYHAGCYPAPHALANSWDKEVVRGVARAIASDCIDEAIDIILAPGVNMKRSPLCGRNFEYFSEDPYLAGELAAEYVIACQEMGVGTSLKHFCANNREWDRCHQVSEVDERTLREIYTKAFEIVLKKVQPWMVMSSYNALNGVNMSENAWALKGILREKLGFENVIVSDWVAVHDRTEALKATLDLQAPNSLEGRQNLQDALEKGELPLDMVDESVGRILKLVERVEEARKTRKALPVEERIRLSVEAAEKSIVLLKNDGVLPLKDKNILLAGSPVESPYVVGGGSAQVQTKKKPSLCDTLQTAIPDATIDYSWLYHASNCLQTPSGQPRVMNVRGVLQKAYDNDVTILVVGNPTNVETESFDRSELKLNPVVEDLILRIAERAQKLVVVVEAGSAIDMSAWIDAVDAVVYTGYVGEYVNVALANVLSGKVNPSGRLSETFPLCVEDSPTGRDKGGSYADFYSEGVLIGYRWYDTLNIPVLFPFGYGLSYSEFKYDDFKVEKKSETDYEVSFTIENLSDREGGEVAQLYVRNVDMMVVRPEKELRHFEKVYLKAGEKKTVAFKVEKDCFEYYNVCRGGWTLDGGRYEILVCRDAETIMFRHKVVI